MKTATYFQPSKESATTLYHDDGKTPYSYWNIIYRPSGSINASANDMANYVRFYLNRGNVNGVQVLPVSSIDRMESATSTWAARDGLKASYGLSNYWTTYDGFVYHGHNGGVEGGLTEMAYMPDYDVGFFYSINSGNGVAFGKVGKLIRAYIIRNLKKPDLPTVGLMPATAAAYSGWYEVASPRVQLMHFIDRLSAISRVSFDHDKLLLTSLGGTQVYVPIVGQQFRRVPKKDPSEPIATLALLTPNEEGRFIQLGLGMMTMKRIPAWFAIVEIAATGFVVLALISILLYAPFWIFGGLSKKRRRPAERAMRIWPLVTVLSLIGAMIVFMLSSDEMIESLGNLTGWSAALFLLTIVFAVSSLFSAVAVWRSPKQGVRSSVRIYSVVVTVALLIATVYLAFWGIIGLRTWA
jgi:hypothetical protein